jgi:hypothetical protein
MARFFCEDLPQYGLTLTAPGEAAFVPLLEDIRRRLNAPGRLLFSGPPLFRWRAKPADSRARHGVQIARMLGITRRHGRLDAAVASIMAWLDSPGVPLRRLP